MGLSDRPTDAEYEYTLKSRIDDLDRLMSHAAPEGPVTLVLHDWGGMIGMGWAVRHPERVKAIVALNTGCFRLPAEKPFPGLLKVLRGALTGVPLRAFPFARRLILRTCTNKVVLSEEAMDGYLAPYEGWRESRAVHRFVQDIPLSAGDPAWETVVSIESKLDRLKKTPMFLPWGMKDWVFDETFLNGWTKRFPNAVVKRFDDCGHFLLEDAAAEVVPMIRDFVAGPVRA